MSYGILQWVQHNIVPDQPKKKRSAKYDVGGIFVQGKISYEDEYIYHNLWIISIQLLKAIIPIDNYLEELSWSKELLNK